MAKEKLSQVMDALGLQIESTFVPWEKSRDYKPGKVSLHELSLNWRVTLKRGDRELLTTDYGAGIGHCPSYKQKLSGGFTLDEAEAIRFECAQGKRAKERGSAIGMRGGTAILPDPLDVLHSLSMDADVLNYSTYEEWAEAYGYDPDSRKGEKVYKVCLEIALRLRNGIGDEGLQKLQEAGQDY